MNGQSGWPQIHLRPPGTPREWGRSPLAVKGERYGGDSRCVGGQLQSNEYLLGGSAQRFDRDRS
jgi:hypothetical protein